MNNINKRRKPLLSYSRRPIRRIISSNDHHSSLLTYDNSSSNSSSDSNGDTYKSLQSVITSQAVSNNFHISTNEILSNNDDLADSSTSDSSSDLLSSDPLVYSDKDSNLSPSYNNPDPIQYLEEFESSLRVWAINNNITHSALSQLLVILNNHTNHNNLPLDA